MIKRYLVFASEDYYPAGGWGDFIGAFDSLAEAFSAMRAAEKHGKSAHVVDLETLDYVYEGAR